MDDSDGPGLDDVRVADRRQSRNRGCSVGLHSILIWPPAFQSPQSYLGRSPGKSERLLRRRLDPANFNGRLAGERVNEPQESPHNRGNRLGRVLLE